MSDETYDGETPEPTQPQAAPDLLAPMEFDDLEPKQVPIYIKDKKGVKHKFILLEAGEADHVAWRNHQLRASRVEGDRIVGSLGDLAGCRPLLVARCLCLTNPDGSLMIRRISRGGKEAVDEPVRVERSFVDTLPSRIIDGIYDRLLRISGMADGGGPPVPPALGGPPTSHSPPDSAEPSTS